MQGALCTVSIFLLYILLIWGAYAPNTPHAYGPALCKIFKILLSIISRAQFGA